MEERERKRLRRLLIERHVIGPDDYENASLEELQNVLNTHKNYHLPEPDREKRQGADKLYNYFFNRESRYDRTKHRMGRVHDAAREITIPTRQGNKHYNINENGYVEKDGHEYVVVHAHDRRFPWKSPFWVHQSPTQRARWKNRAAAPPDYLNDAAGEFYVQTRAYLRRLPNSGNPHAREVRKKNTDYQRKWGITNDRMKQLRAHAAGRTVMKETRPRHNIKEAFDALRAKVRQNKLLRGRFHKWFQAAADRAANNSANIDQSPLRAFQNPPRDEDEEDEEEYQHQHQHHLPEVPPPPVLPERDVLPEGEVLLPPNFVFHIRGKYAPWMEMYFDSNNNIVHNPNHREGQPQYVKRKAGDPRHAILINYNPNEQHSSQQNSSHHSSSHHSPSSSHHHQSSDHHPRSSHDSSSSHRAGSTVNPRSSLDSSLSYRAGSTVNPRSISERLSESSSILSNIASNRSKDADMRSQYDVRSVGSVNHHERTPEAISSLIERSKSFHDSVNSSRSSASDPNAEIDGQNITINGNYKFYKQYYNNRKGYVIYKITPTVKDAAGQTKVNPYWKPGQTLYATRVRRAYADDGQTPIGSTYLVFNKQTADDLIRQDKREIAKKAPDENVTSTSRDYVSILESLGREIANDPMEFIQNKPPRSVAKKKKDSSSSSDISVTSDHTTTISPSSERTPSLSSMDIWEHRLPSKKAPGHKATDEDKSKKPKKLKHKKPEKLSRFARANIKRAKKLKAQEKHRQQNKPEVPPGHHLVTHKTGGVTTYRVDSDHSSSKDYDIQLKNKPKGKLSGEELKNFLQENAKILEKVAQRKHIKVVPKLKDNQLELARTKTMGGSYRAQAQGNPRLLSTINTKDMVIQSLYSYHKAAEISLIKQKFSARAKEDYNKRLNRLRSKWRIMMKNFGATPEQIKSLENSKPAILQSYFTRRKPLSPNDI